VGGGGFSPHEEHGGAFTTEHNHVEVDMDEHLSPTPPHPNYNVTIPPTPPPFDGHLPENNSIVGIIGLTKPKNNKELELGGQKGGDLGEDKGSNQGSFGSSTKKGGDVESKSIETNSIINGASAEHGSRARDGNGNVFSWIIAIGVVSGKFLFAFV
jgi:hypothetical protein